MAAFVALRYLITRPKLFFLSFFPGAITFGLSGLIVYLLWTSSLGNLTLWLSLPVMALCFLLAWVMLGGFSLVLIEDRIIDECQLAIWNEVRLPAAPFSPRRFGK